MTNAELAEAIEAGMSSAEIADRHGLTRQQVNRRRAALDMSAPVGRPTTAPGAGHLWSIGVAVGTKPVGVAIIGRPVARMLDDGYTVEVTRCTTDGTPNACSMLYSAAWRGAQARGYLAATTMTDVDEAGASLRGAGWRAGAAVSACHNGWARASRPDRETSANPNRLRWWAPGTTARPTEPIEWPQSDNGARPLPGLT